MPARTSPLAALLLVSACATGGGGGAPSGNAPELALRCEHGAALAANDAVIAASDGERYAAARRMRAVLLADMGDADAASAAIASVASETRAPEAAVRRSVASDVEALRARRAGSLGRRDC